MLKKLLQSKNPLDLQAANRLIKNLVDEESRRIERRAELHSLIDRIDTSTTLLGEMLDQDCLDCEIVEELVNTCRSLRGKLGGLATETGHEATSLCHASEMIETVLNMYEERKKNPVKIALEDNEKKETMEPEKSLADELLMNLCDVSSIASVPTAKKRHDSDNLLNLDNDDFPSTSVSLEKNEELKSKSPTRREVFDEIGKLSRDLMEKSLLGAQTLHFTCDSKR